MLATKLLASIGAIMAILSGMVTDISKAPLMKQCKAVAQAAAQDVSVGASEVLGASINVFNTVTNPWWFSGGVAAGSRRQSPALNVDKFGNATTTGNIALDGTFVTYVSTTISLASVNGGASFTVSNTASTTLGLGYKQSGIYHQGGLNQIITSSTFNWASSTLGCVKNPFSVTSTLDYGSISISGAPTTSQELYFVTSTNGFLANVNASVGAAGYPASSSMNLINSVQVASTTMNANALPFFVNGVNELGQLPQQVNYAYAGLALRSGGSDIVSSTFNFRVPVAPNEYQCLYATSTNIGTGTGGTVSPLLFMNNLIYNASNTFQGNFILRWLR